MHSTFANQDPSISNPDSFDAVKTDSETQHTEQVSNREVHPWNLFALHYPQGNQALPFLILEIWGKNNRNNMGKEGYSVNTEEKQLEMNSCI